VDVVNASGVSGRQSIVMKALTAQGLFEGTETTASERLSTSVIYYGAGGGDAAAQQVSSTLGGITVEQDNDVSANHVRVVLGRDFSMPSSLGGSGGTTSPSTPSSPPPAPPTDPSNPMSNLQGGQVPCVR
jgi:hypothetical protein